MRANLVDFIVCTQTQERLKLHVKAQEGDEIIEGTLVSVDSENTYPVTRGIPRMLPDADQVSKEAQATVDRFGAQWNDFDFIGEHYENQFLGWISPNTPETFKDKLGLEGGCGKGRHSALAARWGAKEVFAVDLGSAVEGLTKHPTYPNVHVIQADLFHLPIVEKSVMSHFLSAFCITRLTPDRLSWLLVIVSVKAVE